MDRINCLEKEITEIRKKLHEKETELYTLKKQWINANSSNGHDNTKSYEHIVNNSAVQPERLPRWAIERYSRQILLPQLGVRGQAKLCSGRVLVVGAGGLGCPAAAYLAGAGVGTIGVVDYDTVEITNVHRQILHGEGDERLNKVDSAADTLRRMNSSITIKPYNVQLDSRNALDIVTEYDVVLDCTDNVPTRYLLNDVCVLTKRPLISGSALKMEGQLTIYGYREKEDCAKAPQQPPTPPSGPCYRCVFPAPPPAAAVGSCSADGVAGPVPGTIGVLQALEALKYLAGLPRDKLLVGRMVLFDGEDMTFRNVKLRAANPECAACSSNATITKLIDYEQFCKARAKEKRKKDGRLNTELRQKEHDRRMTGKSYLGARVTERDGKKKWVRDVPKPERAMGPPCDSKLCCNKDLRHCKNFSDADRTKIFKHFWNELNWSGKRAFVRSLIDVVSPKRRRGLHKGDKSRKVDSRLYHLSLEEERLPVCRVMFCNTLSVKEAMIRKWLNTDEMSKAQRKPWKAMNADSFLDGLPKFPPQCPICRKNGNVQYVNVEGVKNATQLYAHYAKDFKSTEASSRKTFMKVFVSKNLRVFKPRYETDICDVDDHHNKLHHQTCRNGTNGPMQSDVPATDYNYIQWQ